MRLSIALVVALLPVLSCSDSRGSCLAACYDHITISGLVPVAYDALNDGSINWCVGWSCTAAHLVEPLGPHSPPGSWSKMSPQGEVLLIGPKLIRVQLWSVIGPGPDREKVKLRIDDAAGSPVYEFEREVEFSHHGICGTRCRNATVAIDSN
ncbi:MAG TPA: hypothetical protein PKA88_01415 [Polyangiaceae bacterium]|nr:hypothetical protein [Polyangiaceae bacterium]HMR80748.1 hypothetical protein [Polyangiaceae bacterium]